MLSVVLNIVLDVLFIYYLNMGISGAALASGLSALIVFILFISKFIRKEGTLVISTFQLDLRAIGSMAYNGSSEAVTQFSAGSSMLIFQFSID
ncbi:hypothetical protein J14TS5_45050 [Paenibacillus lautus]|nr:hypothetical protein J14TS5_45050 [Paenibacillus lautus]